MAGLSLRSLLHTCMAYKIRRMRWTKLASFALQEQQRHDVLVWLGPCMRVLGVCGS